MKRTRTPPRVAPPDRTQAAAQSPADEAPSASSVLLREAAGGCEFHVHVVPNASRTEACGMHGDALRVRLAAPPIDGRANAELLQWLAAALGVPRRAVELVAGESARRKRVRVALDAPVVRAWLDAAAAS